MISRSASSLSRRRSPSGPCNGSSKDDSVPEQNEGVNKANSGGSRSAYASRRQSSGSENSSSLFMAESSNFFRGLRRILTPEMELIEMGNGLVSSSDESDDNFSECSLSSDFEPLLPSTLVVETTKRDDKPKAKLTTEDKSSEGEPESQLVTFARNNLVSDDDVAQYMAGREMTPLQERMNAITVIPSVLFCIFYLVSGAWLTADAIAKAHEHGDDYSSPKNAVIADFPILDDRGCIHSTWFPRLVALPPLPVMAAAFGIIAHAPFSFIYHWKYAHRLPPGYARTDHWSRRLDQAMIHVISASMSFATSGSWDFFAANLLFNLDCMYRQFKKRVRPRANKVRIVISILAYTLPVLRRGDIFLFTKLWTVFLICGWLFVKYPIGGWSHSVFHIVVALIPPLLMTAALDLPASQDQLALAAHCALSAAAR